MCSPYVYTNERAIGDDGVASDEKVHYLAGRSKYEPSDGVRDVSDVVGWPHGDIGRSSHLQTSEIGAAQASSTARGGKFECLGRRERIRLAGAQASNKERLLQLRQEVASFIRGYTVDTEPDRSPCIEEVPNWTQTRREPSIRTRAVGNAGTGCSESDNLRGVEMDGMCEPHVTAQPSEVLDDIDLAPAKAFQ
jgi:hypothetical protein